MTGATPELPGEVASVMIHELESVATDSAKKLGYKRAVTTCTNKVTAHLSVNDFGYKTLEIIPYDEKVKGTYMFRGNFPSGHEEAVLCELIL